jgi:hypothetical protein
MMARKQEKTLDHDVLAERQRLIEQLKDLRRLLQG